MSRTPAGPITAGLLGIQDVLANMPAFQAWVGAESAEEARAKAVLFDYTGGADQTSSYESEPLAIAAFRPFACLWQTEHLALDWISGGEQYYLDPGADVYLELQQADAYPDDRDAGYWDFVSAIDGIIQGLRDEAGTSGGVPIHRIRLAALPMRSPPDEDPSNGGGYWVACLRLSWGRRGGGA